MALLAADALVSRCLDYCNSLFRGSSCFSQHKLQSIQNSLAHVVTNSKLSFTAAALKLQHWFINFYIVVLPVILDNH